MAPDRKITIPKPGTACENTVGYDPGGLPRKCIFKAVMIIENKALCRRCAEKKMKA
jgi:hypothetical protein